jgi:MFS family permease
MGLGGTVYTSFGGVLADMNWRYPFLIYLTSFLVLPLALTTLREPRHESAKLPVETGRVEARTSAHQLLPLGALASIYGTVWLMQVIFYLIPVQMPFYLQSEFTTSGTLVGVAIGLGTLSYSIGSLLSPRVSDRMPRTTLIPLSFGLIAVGYGIVGFAPSYLIVIVGLVIGGQGFGYIIPQMSVWLTTIVPVHLRGRALGVQTTFVFLGHFLSPILAQPIIQAQGFRGAYNSGALLLICLAGVVVVANLLRPRSNAS